MRGKHSARAAARLARAESQTIAELEAENARLRQELNLATKPERSDAEMRAAQEVYAAREARKVAEEAAHRARLDLERVTEQRDKLATDLARIHRDDPDTFRASMEVYAILGELGLADGLSRGIRRVAKGGNLGFANQLSDLMKARGTGVPK